MTEGIIVSNDKSKIDYFKEMSLNGMGVCIKQLGKRNEILLVIKCT